MRLLCVLREQEKAVDLSTFLNKEGIENQLEIDANTDWGSSEYGDIDCKIWIYQEEQFDQAQEWLNQFEQNPNDPRFIKTKHAPKINLSPINEDIEPEVEPEPITKWDKQPLGNLTYFLFLVCCLLFIISNFTAPEIPKVLETEKITISYTPILTSALYKNLLFDYPAAFEILDKLIQSYGVENVVHPNTLPPEGTYFLQKYYKTPYWQGFYDIIVNHFKSGTPLFEINAPLFEKIREGQVWRLFSPCILHYDIFHLFFNMIWLLVLGKQLEQRIRKFRYIIFIIITGILSNIAQYFMGGFEFLGFSGVLCAMLGFVWARKKYAPWEGYQLQKSTINFIAFYVFLMFGIQFISFLLEIFSTSSLPVTIGNTAHISGGIIGYLLGRFNFFSWRNNISFKGQA